MTEKKKTSDDVQHVITRLLRYMVSYKTGLCVVLVCMVISAYCTAQGTYLLKPAINDYILPLVGKEKPDYSDFFLLLARMAVLYGIAATATWMQGKIMVKISNNTLFRLRTDLFETLQKMSLSDFSDYAHGRLLSLFTNDVNAMNNMLRQSLPRIVNGIATCLTLLVTMFLINRLMALVVLICCFLITLFLRGIVKKNSGHFAQLQHEIGLLSSHAQENLSGRYTVKVFGQEEAVCRKFNEINYKLCRSTAKSSFYADAIFNLTNGLSGIGFTMVALAGTTFTLIGKADIGTVGAFLQFYRQLFTPMKDMSKQFNNILSALAGAERVFGFLDNPSEEDYGTVRLISDNGVLSWEIPSKDGTSEHKQFIGRISFNHVNFGYGNGNTVLHDFTLDIEPGQKTAFVGSTGAGKTTIINLFSRFYEIYSGQITCDGIDIRNIRKADLRSVAGVVQQEVNLFTGTVEDNIRFGREDASPEEIRQAATTVCADSFIRRLPEEYNTIITANGELLSQGHRQLLSLARTAVTGAPILILDEATSSVDTRTEMLINQGLDRLMKNKTVLVIAHRLSTIRNADKIVVLDNGRIAECGTYDELINLRGLFYRLNSAG